MMLNFSPLASCSTVLLKLASPMYSYRCVLLIQISGGKCIYIRRARDRNAIRKLVMDFPCFLPIKFSNRFDSIATVPLSCPTHVFAAFHPLVAFCDVYDRKKGISFGEVARRER